MDVSPFDNSRTYKDCDGYAPMFAYIGSEGYLANLELREGKQHCLWWTNTGFTDREVIGHYHAHGESEQFHSELKTNMDLERLPSGNFETNDLVLELAMLSYNILRMIGQESLGKKNPHLKQAVKRRRHRTVINNLINMACHVTEHARKLTIGLGKSNVWRNVFRHVYYAFEYFAL